MTQPDEPGRDEEPIVRDKRRIDPETGAVRDESAEQPVVEVPDDLSGLDDAPAAAAEPAAGEPTDAALAAERLADLQRLQAEFVNYRKRVERDREQAKDAGVIKVVEALMPLLDEVELARTHGDLTGPYEVHATKLYEALGKLGVVRFGEVGEPFDPAVHEALMQQTSDEVDAITVTTLVSPGYRLGDRVLRAARVIVTQPA